MSLDPISDVVDDVRRGLPPILWAFRRSVLREIEDGLRDAQASYVAAGWDAGAAASRAVRDFGDPAEVADELAADAGARAVRRLAAAQAVIVVSSVVGWAAVGSTSSGGAPDPGSGLASIYALFLVVAVPAVLVGLLAHRRLGTHLVSTDAVRRWGVGTSLSAALTLLATHGTSLLKARVADLPAEPGDAWLSTTSNVVGGVLLGWACLVLLAMAQLHRAAGERLASAAR